MSAEIMQDQTTVADYLSNNPHFFYRYPHLLDIMQVDHPVGGHKTSLTERHMVSLREQNEALRAEIDDMLHHAQRNEVTLMRLHQLTLSLLRASTLERTLEALRVAMADFDVPYLRLCLWEKGGANWPDFICVNPALHHFSETLNAPYCGGVHGLELSGWFGDDATSVSSQALIPLRNDGVDFGLLALGSPDSTQFTESMDTHYLCMLGDILSATLQEYVVSPPGHVQAATTDELTDELPAHQKNEEHVAEDT